MGMSSYTCFTIIKLQYTKLKTATEIIFSKFKPYCLAFGCRKTSSLQKGNQKHKEKKSSYKITSELDEN